MPWKGAYSEERGRIRWSTSQGADGRNSVLLRKRARIRQLKARMQKEGNQR